MLYLQVKPLQLNWRSSTRSKVQSTYAPFSNKSYSRDLTVCQVTRVASKWLPAEIPSSCHYNDVIMSAMTSQIASLTICYSTVYSCADQRKHQSSASLAFVRGIHRWPVNSPHKGPVIWKTFPFDEVIMYIMIFFTLTHHTLPATLLIK